MTDRTSTPTPEARRDDLTRGDPDMTPVETAKIRNAHGRAPERRRFAMLRIGIVEHVLFGRDNLAENRLDASDLGLFSWLLLTCDMDGFVRASRGRLARDLQCGHTKLGKRLRRLVDLGYLEATPPSIRAEAWVVRIVNYDPGTNAESVIPNGITRTGSRSQMGSRAIPNGITSFFGKWAERRYWTGAAGRHELCS